MYRPEQSVCSRPACQRHRRADYHRQKIKTDPVYAQVVRDSQRKWREAHPDYQSGYRQKHLAAVEQNRQMQQRRDRRRRVQLLVKNNVALDLKHSAGEVWLLGPNAAHLEKNNLASCQFFIFQSHADVPPTPTGS